MGTYKLLVYFGHQLVERTQITVPSSYQMRTCCLCLTSTWTDGILCENGIYTNRIMEFLAYFGSLVKYSLNEILLSNVRCFRRVMGLLVDTLLAWKNCSTSTLFIDSLTCLFIILDCAMYIRWEVSPTWPNNTWYCSRVNVLNGIFSFLSPTWDGKYSGLLVFYILIRCVSLFFFLYSGSRPEPTSLSNLKLLFI